MFRLNKKLMWLFCLPVLLFVLISGCAKEKKVYKIGAIFAITGPASPLGTPERDTVKLLEEQINQAGGINGHRLKVIIYDTAGDETKCRMAVKKLIYKDKVLAIIGPSRSGTTLAIIDEVQKAEIPLISCAASIKIVEPVKKWVFKTPQSDVLAVAKIIDYLKEHNIDKIAIINVSNPYGISGKEQLDIQAPQAGIQVVAHEEFGQKDPDMTAQLTRIKGTDAQAVICWGTNPGPAIVARNMRQLGMQIPLIQSHGIANKKFIELAGEAAEGVVFPAGRLIVAEELPDSDPQKSLLLKYANDFQQKYGRSADTFGGHAWDALQLVVSALKKAGPDKAKIRDEIENTRNFIGTGGIFNFSPTEHNGLTKEAFVMVTIRDGNWTLLK